MPDKDREPGTIPDLIAHGVDPYRCTLCGAAISPREDSSIGPWCASCENKMANRTPGKHLQLAEKVGLLATTQEVVAAARRTREVSRFGASSN